MIKKNASRAQPADA